MSGSDEAIMQIFKGPDARHLERLAGAPSSWRVFNLHLATSMIQSAGRPSYLRFFQTHSLNRALFIKHSVRESEEQLFDTAPAVATKILIPLDGRSLAHGAVSVFIGERAYQHTMLHWLGVKIPFGRTVMQVSDDAAILRQLDELPMFDPHLSGAAFGDGAFGIAEDYVQISLTDDLGMRSFIMKEVAPMVQLAGGSPGRVGRFVDAMFGPRLDPQAIDFLKSLGLPESRWQSIVSSWKAALRFEAGLNTLQQRFAFRYRQMSTMPVYGGLPADVEPVRQGILSLARQVYGDVAAAADALGRARRSTIARGEIQALGAYLAALPGDVEHYANHLAVAEHVVSFWEVSTRAVAETGIAADALSRLEFDLRRIAHQIRQSFAGESQSLIGFQRAA
jgi:hypothetical protein